MGASQCEWVRRRGEGRLRARAGWGASHLLVNDNHMQVHFVTGEAKLRELLPHVHRHVEGRAIRAAVLTARAFAAEDAAHARKARESEQRVKLHWRRLGRGARRGEAHEEVVREVDNACAKMLFGC